MYGDWKTENRTEIKENYLNENFYKNNNWDYYVLLSRAMTKISRILY
jgi:hypothetical protein